MGNISHLLVSNSTQLDNVDLMGGPRDFTITEVAETNDREQPLSVTLAEYERPWKPGLTMRRLLAGLYGDDDDKWVGKRVRLFRDESVSFGKQKTGGTRISHASHINKPITLTLPISKGKFGEFTVQPLTDPAPTPALPEPTAEEVAACTDVAQLQEWWQVSGAERQTQIVARAAEVKAANEGGQG